MDYFDVILLSDVIWAFEPKVTRRVTYITVIIERKFVKQKQFLCLVY